MLGFVSWLWAITRPSQFHSHLLPPPVCGPFPLSSFCAHMFRTPPKPWLPRDRGLPELRRPNYFRFSTLWVALLCFVSVHQYSSRTYQIDLHHPPPSLSAQVPTGPSAVHSGPPEVKAPPSSAHGAAHAARTLPASGGKETAAIGRKVFHSNEIFKQEYKEMNGSFKIYVYPHGRSEPFARALLPVDFVPGGNYASESYFKRALAGSHFVTEDPAEADLFFMPFSIASLRYDRRVGVKGIPGFVQAYLSHVVHDYPYWNRSGGADHFYVACHSIGRSAMDRAEEIKLNAIQIVCSSSYFLSGYVPHKDASVPQIWPRKGTPPHVPPSRRKKLAFFAGAVNSADRMKLLQAWRNDSEMWVHSGRLTTPYSDALLGSKYCLHVKGFEVNTARIADAVHHGCVPVVIANHYDLPFADVLDWRSFSVVLDASDIPLLKEVLRGIGPDEYAALQGNVMKVRRHFRWNARPRDYDAFHMVMYELWLRRSVVRLPLPGAPSAARNATPAKCSGLI